MEVFVPFDTKVNITSNRTTNNIAVLVLCLIVLLDFLKSIINRFIGIAPRNKQAKTDGCNIFKQKKVTNQIIAFRTFKQIIE